MIYVMVKVNNKQFPISFKGQTQAEIDAMLPITYPGCTWEPSNEVEYAAFEEAHRPAPPPKLGPQT